MTKSKSTNHDRNTTRFVFHRIIECHTKDTPLLVKKGNEYKTSLSALNFFNSALDILVLRIILYKIHFQKFVYIIFYFGSTRQKGEQYSNRFNCSFCLHTSLKVIQSHYSSFLSTLELIWLQNVPYSLLHRRQLIA